MQECFLFRYFSIVQSPAKLRCIDKN